MLEIIRKFGPFHYKEVWFKDLPADIQGYPFVIYRACPADTDLKGFEKQEDVTLTIDLNQSQESIWGNINKSSKSKINRAQREGVEIRINSDYKDFYALNISFREKKGLVRENHSIDFIKDHTTLFTAWHEGELLCGNAFIKSDECIRYYFGSTKRLNVSKDQANLISRANRLLFWKAICYGIENKIPEFDLGGYYTGDADIEYKNVSYFKRSFSDQITTKFTYQKFYSRAYKILVNIYKLTR